MSILKDSIINGIIDREGDFVNNPNDSGGPTRWGITQQVARENNYIGPMERLPKHLAFSIYEKRYWAPLNLDAIEKLSTPITQELADTAANQGVNRAARFLQRALNVLNNKATQWPDLVVDGQLGDKTIEALKKYLFIRGIAGEVVLFNMLNSLQGAFYIELAERREKDEEFIFGWFTGRVS
ncbi:MAG: hypothetical protein OQK82_00690 [Candidatus Pacearchaeota archaeon]|nr:hypothetical protein [Candidatus Pacearchaeota archaeon]